MKAVEVKDLIPGMVLEKKAVSAGGTVVMNAGDTVTEASITALHMNYIFSVYIVDESIPLPGGDDDKVYSSRSERIKNSPEFKEFKRRYEATVVDVKSRMNDIVERNSKTLDTEGLLREPLELLQDKSTLEIFDMLHNLRSYDDTTYIHSINVALISGIIARWARLPESEIQLAILCGLIHDIGKLEIPDSIIKKPGKLTAAEYKAVKNHTIDGYKILDDYDIKGDLKNAALMHHERADGTGYPFSLHDNQITRMAKIVSIADVYDAMTSARSYRGPLCPFSVIDIMIAEGLQKYDTRLILIFLENMGSTYLNNRVRLTDEEEGEIVFVEKNHPSRPIVKTDDGKMICLKDTDLRVQEIL